MAAPADVTIADLNGVWLLDTSLTRGVDEVLKLQGISWALRTAISLASIKLLISEYTEPDPTTSEPTVHVDIVQILSGGLAHIPEKRIINWTDLDHKDYIFGNIVGRARFVRGSEADNDIDGGQRRVRPNIQIESSITIAKDARTIAEKFLRGELAIDGITPEPEGFLVDDIQGGERFGDGEGLWLQGFARNIDVGVGWTAEQIWGFETINGERRHTRRVFVAHPDGGHQLAWLVYRFMGRKESDGS